MIAVKVALGRWRRLAQTGHYLAIANEAQAALRLASLDSSSFLHLATTHG
jgi:hypothetical protein